MKARGSVRLCDERVSTATGMSVWRLVLIREGVRWSTRDSGGEWRLSLGDRAMGRFIRYSIPRLYYLVTPAFIVLDYVGGVSVRVAVLDGMPLYKSLYYSFCILCGVAVYFLPDYSAVVALFESPVNLVITILGLVLPYIERIKQFDDVLNTAWSPVPDFSVPYLTNLVLAAGVSAFAFLQANKALSGRFEAATWRRTRRSQTE
jgi:hypothetical protein